MKAKIHIDIGQYEFIEFETEFTTEQLRDPSMQKVLQALYKDYHKMGERVVKWKRPKEELLTDTDKLSAIS